MFFQTLERCRRGAGQREVNELKFISSPTSPDVTATNTFQLPTASRLMSTIQLLECSFPLGSISILYFFCRGEVIVQTCIHVG